MSPITIHDLASVADGYFAQIAATAFAARMSAKELDRDGHQAILSAIETLATAGQRSIEDLCADHDALAQQEAKENAHPGGGPGQALRGGSPNAKLVPSKRPPARGRLVKLNQPYSPVSLAPAPTFYPTSRVLSRPHLSPVSVGLRNSILETDSMTKQSHSASTAPHTLDQGGEHHGA